MDRYRIKQNPLPFLWQFKDRAVFSGALPVNPFSLHCSDKWLTIPVYHEAAVIQEKRIAIFPLLPLAGEREREP
jgi:hypothetical protein